MRSEEVCGSTVNRLRTRSSTFAPPRHRLFGAAHDRLHLSHIPSDFPPALHRLERALLRKFPALRDPSSGRCLVDEVTLFAGVRLRSAKTVELKAAHTADGTLFGDSTLGPPRIGVVKRLHSVTGIKNFWY